MKFRLMIVLLIIICINTVHADMNTQPFPAISEFVTFTNPISGTADLNANQVFLHDNLSSVLFWNKLLINIIPNGARINSPFNFSLEFTNSTGAKCIATPSQPITEAMGPYLNGGDGWPDFFDISACSANGGYTFTKLRVILRTNNRGFGLPYEYNAQNDFLLTLIRGSSPIVKLTLEAKPRLVGTVVSDSTHCAPQLGKTFTCDIKNLGTVTQCAVDDKSIITSTNLESAKVFEINYSDNNKIMNESEIPSGNFCLTVQTPALHNTGEDCTLSSSCKTGLCCAYPPMGQSKCYPKLRVGQTSEYQKDEFGNTIANVTIAGVASTDTWTCGRPLSATCSISEQCGSNCCGASSPSRCCKLDQTDLNLPNPLAHCEGQPSIGCI